VHAVHQVRTREFGRSGVHRRPSIRLTVDGRGDFPTGVYIIIIIIIIIIIFYV
jgi:hypothetical protein